ncbi:synaptonemal complex protein 3-like isoform X2 [Acanthaster planci]|nr:synaptonemal complex protein 3-like isoform X2 [Acanthaster planci]XP_022082718.1 synaptonemal complex protein 3-like isoform X2 [Acanthaster planci]XP_022082719.1 synaptonemal complex protein 3-like isoform X2 [Acanthaster planci]
MPRASTAAKKATPTASTQKDKSKEPVDKYDFYEDNQEEAAGSSREDDASTAPKATKKRFYEEVDEDEEGSLPQTSTNFDGEMQTMLESFGADIRKSLVSKRKKLENFTQQSLKSANIKVEKIWKMQQTERNRLQEEYTKQLSSVLDQWETDVNKVKEQEEKIQTVFRQQQKLFQQSRITMSQRLKTIRQLFDQYSKTMNELEQCHTDQQSHVQGELRKEMSMLQKKILMDTQNQEMANVRKSLQTMFF